MKITVFNLKGGQGKTTISLALATLYDFFVVTNDEYSPIDSVLEEGRVKHLTQRDGLPDVPDDIDLIYDFGGYPDKRVIDAVKQSDWVIVPVFYKSPLDMQTTINTLREIEEYNSNILIVVNQTKKESFGNACEVLKDFCDYPVFEVKDSTAFIKMVEQKQSIKQLMEENFLYRYHYKKPLEQIEQIAQYIFKD